MIIMKEAVLVVLLVLETYILIQGFVSSYVFLTFHKEKAGKVSDISWVLGIMNFAIIFVYCLIAKPLF